MFRICCTKCGKEKPITEFYKKKNGKYGVQSVCKKCQSEYGKQYRATHLDYFNQKSKEHMDEQLSESMSWDNYGTFWNIDHIIPQSLYNLQDKNELKKCWSLRNLRPLLKTKNKEKSDMLDLRLIEDLLPQNKEVA